MTDTRANMSTNTTTPGAQRSIYTFTCTQTGETAEVIVCPEHAAEMPLVDNDRVRVSAADEELACEFCTDM